MSERPLTFSTLYCSSARWQGRWTMCELLREPTYIYHGMFSGQSIRSSPTTTEEPAAFQKFKAAGF
eukprot:scaffold220437_cov28-Prasinocladus_malaysianus.AAC.1